MAELVGLLPRLGAARFLVDIAAALELNQTALTWYHYLTAAAADMLPLYIGD